MLPEEALLIGAGPGEVGGGGGGAMLLSGNDPDGGGGEGGGGAATVGGFAALPALPLVPLRGLANSEAGRTRGSVSVSPMADRGTSMPTSPRPTTVPTF